MKLDELEQRVAMIRSEIEALIDEIDEQVPDRDGKGRPDTARFMQTEYMMGPPSGLCVALEALPVRRIDTNPDYDAFEGVLDPASVQRKRHKARKPSAEQACAAAELKMFIEKAVSKKT